MLQLYIVLYELFIIWKICLHYVFTVLFINLIIRITKRKRTFCVIEWIICV